MVTWCGWVGNRFGRRAGWLTVRSFVHRSCVRDCVVRVGGESIRAAGRLVGCSFVCSRSCVVAWLHVAWAGEGGGGSIRAAGRLVGCSMLLAFGFAASNDLPRGRHPITISHLSRSNAAHTPLPTHTHTHTHTHTRSRHTHTHTGSLRRTNRAHPPRRHAAGPDRAIPEPLPLRTFRPALPRVMIAS